MAKPDAVRITTARTSAAADMKSRQRRYAVSMTIRTVCFAVAVGDGVLRWILVGAAVFLPFLAVVVGNAADTRDDGFALPDAPYTRELKANETQD